jgi:hypothetical protein
MDICIAGDNAVSKEKHAFVSYNPENHVFKLIPGESRGLVYLNGEDVDMATRLNPLPRSSVNRGPEKSTKMPPASTPQPISGRRNGGVSGPFGQQ